MHKPILTLTGLVVALLVFCIPAFADQVTVFTQPLAASLPPIESVTLPTELQVGLALCVGCGLDPLASSILIGPFGPIIAQPVSEVFTVGPSNPAFGPIVQAIQNGKQPTQPPPFYALFPFVIASDAQGNSEFLENGYGVGIDFGVLPTGTVQSISIVVPEISKFEIAPGDDWVAVGPDGKQVYVSWVANGTNIAPEPGTLVSLACGLGLLFFISNMNRAKRAGRVA
jgi:hypothetical protein